MIALPARAALCKGPASRYVWLALLSLSATITPIAHAQHSPLDEVMREGIRRSGGSGGALCIVRNGKLIYAQGYGTLEHSGQQPCLPTSYFRVASLTKLLTAVACLRLVDEGKCTLDDKVFARLKLNLPASVVQDQRIYEITLRDILQHRGGWSSAQDDKLTWGSQEALKLSGKPGPLSAFDLVRYGATQPLSWQPRSKTEYVNFGYLVLGRYIEAVSGKSYQDYVAGNVLRPIGISQVHFVKSRLKDRLLGEVRYYEPEAKSFPSPFPEDRGTLVQRMYGALVYEAADSFGGWVATPVQVARFVASVTSDAKFLSASSRAALVKKPDGVTTNAYTGLGFNFEEGPYGLRFSHGGNMPGVSARVTSRFDGATLIYFINGNNKEATLTQDMERAMLDAAQKVSDTTGWATVDLFKSYPRL